MKTYMAKPGSVERKWYVVDAKGLPLGRLASRVASILRGKNKPTYTPHVDTGDFVIVTNAREVVLTGKKFDKKLYVRHSMHPGGLKVRTARQVLESQPEQLVRKAVWGMLPHNSLGRRLIRKLKVYPGADHPHQAQKPESIELA